MVQQCQKFHYGQKFFSIFSADTPSAVRIDITSCNNNIDIKRWCIGNTAWKASKLLVDSLSLSLS